MDLKDLVIRAQVGDQDAYAAIYQRFREVALAYAYSILGDHGLAEDARQEAFINAYCDLQALRTPAAFPGWFRQIVRKHSIAIRRKRRGLIVPLDSLGGVSHDGLGAADEVDRGQRWAEVAQVIDRLPQGEGEIVRLYYLEEVPLREIGMRVGIPEKTVKSRLHTARARLREQLIEKVKVVARQRQISGDKEPRRSATVEAIRLFSDEIDQLLKVPSEDDQRRAGELVCAKGRMLRFMGQIPEAMAAFERGMAIPALVKDVLYTARLRTEMGLTLIQTADYVKARQMLNRSRSMVGAKPDGRSLLAVIFNGLGLCAWGEGNWREGHRFYTHALESSRAVGLTDLQAQALNNLGLLEWKQGRLADSLSTYKAAMRLWRKVGNRFGVGLVTMNMAIIEENMGQWTVAGKHYREALKLGEEMGFVQLQSACHANLANLALSMEQYDQAMNHSEKARDIAMKIGDRRSEAIALENLALAQAGNEMFAEAGRTINSAQRIARAVGDREREFSLELALLEADLRAGQAIDSRERIARFEQVIKRNAYEADRPRLMRLKVEEALLAGDHAKARRLVKKGLEECQRQRNRSEEKRIKHLERRIASAGRSGQPGDGGS